MKHLMYGAIMLLVIFGTIGCTESPQWEETTLTVINDSGEDIESIEVFIGSISRIDIDYNILDAPLADGGSIMVPLAPVLHPDSNAGIEIESVYEWNFTYEEGAEVVFTWNGNAPDYATWEGGDFTPQA